MPSSIKIRACTQNDKNEWRQLFDGYAAFYKTDMTDEKAERVWNWLMDAEHDLKCILAIHDENIIGLAHYRPMLRPLRGCYIGYLDDLFVAPETRGLKVADKLLDALKDICRENGWEMMRWLTADDNYRARGLYDRHAKKSYFNLYEMDVPN